MLVHSRSSAPPRRRIRPAVLALLAAGAVALLSACSAPQTAATGPKPAAIKSNVQTVSIGSKQIKPGGNLVFDLSGDPDTLDPVRSSTLFSRIVLQPVCEHLYSLEADGSIEPTLAAAMPTVSSDGLTVTFPIRTGLKFSDGTIMTASAVVESLERDVKDPLSARKSEMGPITSITAPSDSEVKITFSSPFSPLMSALVAGGGVIESPAALAKYGADGIAQHPTCIGPFVLQQRIPQTSITLVKNPDYYDAKDIHLDKITYEIQPDSSVRATNLKSGTAQLADSISTQDVDSLSATKNVGILSEDSLGFQQLDVNLASTGIGKPLKPLTSPLATNPKVRLALSMAIDRSALVKSVFNGWYTATCTPIPPTTGFESSQIDACPKYDPTKAKQLLKQAGVQTPYPLQLHEPNTPDNLRVAQALQQMVAKAGFKLTIVPLDSTTANTDSINGDYTLEQQSWSGRLDPNGNVYNFLTTGGTYNRTGYSNAKVDTLLKQASATSDKSERVKLYGEAMEQVHADNPMIFLYRIRNITGYNKEVAGITTTVDGIIDPSRAAFLK